MASYAFFIPITLTIHKSSFEDSLPEDCQEPFHGVTSMLSKGYREYIYSKAKGGRSQEKEYENPPYDDVPKETLIKKHKIQAIKIK